MTKTLNQIIFFPSPQSEYFFFSNIGNQNIFLEKNHNLPLQVKWSVPKDLGVDQFKASNGWLQSFLQRHNIVFRTMSGESGDVNVTIVSEWKSKLPNRLSSKRYL